VKVFSCNRDFIWPNTWPVPRYGPRIFLISLRAIYQEYYGFDFKVIQYGKPEKLTFQFTETLLKQKAQR